MKKTYFAFIMVLFVVQALTAQAVWQNEAVVRQQDFIDWKRCQAVTPDNQIILLYEKGNYANQGLYLHKENYQGEPVWADDIRMDDSSNQKFTYGLLPSSDGDFFIWWKEGNSQTGENLTILKVDADGQQLWQPVILTNSVLGYFYLKGDNTGGIYALCTRDWTNGSDKDVFCQHLNSNGQMLFPEGWLQLTDDPMDEDVCDMIVAPDNSLIFTVMFYSQGNSSVCLGKVFRVLPNQNLAWTSPIYLGNATRLFWMGNILQINQTQFIVTWAASNNPTVDYYMQKFDLSGNVYFNPPVLVYSHDNAIEYHKNCIDDDGNIFIGIDNQTGSVCTDLIKKYDSNGNSLWGNGVTLPDSVLNIMAMTPDDEGGVYLSLRTKEDEVDMLHGFVMQHLNNAGLPVWTNGGISIASNIEDELSINIDFVKTDRLHIHWMKRYDDNYGLYYQQRDLDGNLLSELRRTVLEGLTGNTDLMGTLSRNDDILAIWKDDRFLTTEHKSRLYYQIVNQNGEMELTQNGVMLASNIDESMQSVVSVYLENGNSLILWANCENVNQQLMGQCISPEGNIMWEEEGRCLMDNNIDTGDLYHMDAYSVGNDAYLCFSRTNGVHGRTYIQKITNGQVMWGATGIMVSPVPNDPFPSESPIGFRDGYLVIKGHNTNHTFNYLYGYRFNQDGSLVNGWEPNGVMIENETFQSSYNINANMAVLDGNLYVFSCYGTYDSGAYKYSVLQPDGSIIINQNTLMNDSAGIEKSMVTDNTDGLAFCYNQIDYDGSTAMTGYSKLDDSESFPWGYEPRLVWDDNGTTNNSDLHITGYGNGGYLITRYDYDKVWGSYINAAGENLSPMDGVLLINKCYHRNIDNRLGNGIFITWNDYKSAYHSGSRYEIRMQRYANPSVVFTEDEVSIVSDKLTCYPNPFNCTLNVGVVNAKKSKASISVYNLKGQKVRTIMNGMLDKGSRPLQWDGKDTNGKQVASGVYYIRMDNGKDSKSQKVLYIK